MLQHQLPTCPVAVIKPSKRAVRRAAFFSTRGRDERRGYDDDGEAFKARQLRAAAALKAEMLCADEAPRRMPTPVAITPVTVTPATVTVAPKGTYIPVGKPVFRAKPRRKHVPYGPAGYPTRASVLTRMRG